MPRGAGGGWRSVSNAAVLTSAAGVPVAGPDRSVHPRRGDALPARQRAGVTGSSALKCAGISARILPSPAAAGPPAISTGSWLILTLAADAVTLRSSARILMRRIRSASMCTRNWRLPRGAFSPGGSGSNRAPYRSLWSYGDSHHIDRFAHSEERYHFIYNSLAGFIWSTASASRSAFQIRDRCRVCSRHTVRPPSRRGSGEGRLIGSEFRRPESAGLGASTSRARSTARSLVPSRCGRSIPAGFAGTAPMAQGGDPGLDRGCFPARRRGQTRSRSWLARPASSGSTEMAARPARN